MLQEKTVEIVSAQEEDYDEIISVLNICFKDRSPEDPETLRQLLSVSTTFVAKVEDRIVGTVSYTNFVVGNSEIVETPQHRKSKMCHIWGLAVLPKHRNVGIATNLVRNAERDMRRKKAKGYFGNAFPEEVAQWWVRTFGVRLKRLALDRIMTFGVPFEKRFRQDGFSEHLKKETRRELAYLLGRTYSKARTAWLRRAQKHKPR